MDRDNRASTKVEEGTILIERVFNAPREKVWKAWTDPEWLMRWWGPKTFTSPACMLDLRVGGKYHFCMRAPDGRDYWTAGVFCEITPLERLVYTDSFADAQGNIVPSTYYGMEGIPDELLVTVLLEDLGGKTHLTLRHEGMSKGEADMASQGWNESLDKMAEVVEASGG